MSECTNHCKYNFPIRTFKCHGCDEYFCNKCIWCHEGYHFLIRSYCEKCYLMINQ